MLDAIPDDVLESIPEGISYGVLQFVASDGEVTEDMEQTDYFYVLNQAVGLDRVESDGEGRAKQKVVESDEADDPLPASAYTNNVFNRELQEWARHAIQSED